MSTSDKNQISETVEEKVALLVNAIKIALLHTPAHTFGEYEVLNEDEDGNIAILAQISFNPFDSDEGRITPEPVSIDFEYRVDENEWLIIVGDDFHELCINESSVLSIMYFYSLRPDKEITAPQPEELTLKNPAQVGATIFRPGVRVSTLIDRAEREYIAAQSQEVTPSTIEIAAPPEQEPVNQELIYKIDRDICEGEPYDPDKEDAICISHSDLLSTLNAALGDESPRLYTTPQYINRPLPEVPYKSARKDFLAAHQRLLELFNSKEPSRVSCAYPDCKCPIDKANKSGCLLGLKDNDQEQAATVASEPTEKMLMLGAKIYMEADSNLSKSVIEIVGRIYRAMTEAAKGD